MLNEARDGEQLQYDLRCLPLRRVTKVVRYYEHSTFFPFSRPASSADGATFGPSFISLCAGLPTQFSLHQRNVSVGKGSI